MMNVLAMRLETSIAILSRVSCLANLLCQSLFLCKNAIKRLDFFVIIGLFFRKRNRRICRMYQSF